MLDTKKTVQRAWEKGIVIPAFNVPYLPMVKPIVEAVVKENSVAMVQVARVEWEKFSSGSLEDVAEEYRKYADDEHTMLHLDHVPVIDEDLAEVDYMPIIERALAAGYRSVMIDASRLDLAGNIAATRRVADRAHAEGAPTEAELGAVMGHESGPMMPYEEIFATKKGFTDLSEAERFAAESGCDWLSVAVGNIHGAVAEATRGQKKPEARLDVAHVKALSDAAGVPLVLHGGSGVRTEYIREAIKAGIAKINIGTEIRQAYEKPAEAGASVEQAREATYTRVRELLTGMLGIGGTKDVLG
jgi:ketose-bisphosphate aldolase